METGFQRAEARQGPLGDGTEFAAMLSRREPCRLRVGRARVDLKFSRAAAGGINLEVPRKELRLELVFTT